MNRYTRAAFATTSLALITVGLYLISPAVAMIVLGALLWIDLAAGGKR